MNPFFCYILSFAVALICYSFQWSSVYPKMSSSLLLFLILTMAAHAVAAILWRRITALWPRAALHEDTNPLRITIFIYLLWTLDFIYEGGIPVFKIIFNQPYDYRLFGFPSVHVFTVTFASFYTVYLFHLFLSTRKKLILALYVVNLLAAVLIYSRAMLFFNLTSSLIVYLFQAKKIPLRYVAMMPVVALLLFYFFGILGTLRVSRESGKPYDNSIFLRTGRATETFRNAHVPNEFFWSYIYLSSSLANLQLNISRANQNSLNVKNVSLLINNEILFDFISKRINKAIGAKSIGEHTIPGPFNVSTVYSRAYSYLNWSGMTIMAIFILCLPWLYVRILPLDSPFFVTGIAILCTMFVFMVYDNTIRFTGLGFQLIYPLLFTFAARRNFFHLIRNPS